MNTTEDKINQELEDGTLIKADTLEVLAQKLNIDATTFVNTIERYNTFVELGHDEDFNKNAFDLKSKSTILCDTTKTCNTSYYGWFENQHTCTSR